MCGHRQLLRLLLVLVLFQSTFGIVCYRCQTKGVPIETKDKEPEIVKVLVTTLEPEPTAPARGREGDSRGSRLVRAADEPTSPPTTPPTTPSTPAAVIPGEGDGEPPAAPGEPPAAPSEINITDCLKGGHGGKDDKELWEEVECPIGYKACFVRKGTVVERKGGSLLTYSITERGCFSKDDEPLFKDVAHVVDQRLKKEIKDELGTKFELIVCDEINGGEMLCNRGAPSMTFVNFNWLTGSVLFLLLLWAN